jgi:predicted Zn-dependent peptidase
MNLTKKILFTAVTVLTVYSVQAQNPLKEPIGYKLKNGMNIVISENNQSPKAYSSFTLDGRAFKDKKDGVIELLNAILNEGLEKNENISFKDNGGKLAVVNADFDKELQVMAGLIQNAKINEVIFNAAKAKLTASLKAQDYDYDQTLNENSIRALSLEDVKNFYSQITPANTYLTIAGNIRLEEAKVSAKKAFGRWSTEESIKQPLSK